MAEMVPNLAPDKPLWSLIKSIPDKFEFLPCHGISAPQFEAPPNYGKCQICGVPLTDCNLGYWVAGRFSEVCREHAYIIERREHERPGY